jgi:hypothetical protein
MMHVLGIVEITQLQGEIITSLLSLIMLFIIWTIKQLIFRLRDIDKNIQYLKEQIAIINIITKRIDHK